jgi:hypothetical protein
MTDVQGKGNSFSNSRLEEPPNVSLIFVNLTFHKYVSESIAFDK